MIYQCKKSQSTQQERFKPSVLMKQRLLVYWCYWMYNHGYVDMCTRLLASVTLFHRLKLIICVKQQKASGPFNWWKLNVAVIYCYCYNYDIYIYPFTNRYGFISSTDSINDILKEANSDKAIVVDPC